MEIERRRFKIWGHAHGIKIERPRTYSLTVKLPEDTNQNINVSLRGDLNISDGERVAINALKFIDLPAGIYSIGARPDYETMSLIINGDKTIVYNPEEANAFRVHVDFGSAKSRGLIDRDLIIGADGVLFKTYINKSRLFVSLKSRPTLKLLIERRGKRKELEMTGEQFTDLFEDLERMRKSPAHYELKPSD